MDSSLNSESFARSPIQYSTLINSTPKRDPNLENYPDIGLISRYIRDLGYQEPESRDQIPLRIHEPLHSRSQRPPSRGP